MTLHALIPSVLPYYRISSGIYCLLKRAYECIVPQCSIIDLHVLVYMYMHTRYYKHIYVHDLHMPRIIIIIIVIIIILIIIIIIIMIIIIIRII